jgi:type I restriction enzyme S subunit
LSNLATAKLGDIVDVTDFVANGSFESLRLNVTYSQVPEFAVLVRLVDHNRSWAGPFTYVNRGSYDFLKKSSLVAGDVVIANVGANAGTVFRVPELGYPMTLGPNAVLCRPRDLGNFDSNYMYYFLSGETGQSLIDSIIGGSAQPKFNKTGLRQLMLPVPPISQQRAVADVLVALDDKIAANTKLAETAGRMATTLFDLAASSPTTDRPLAEVVSTQYGLTTSAHLEPGPKFLRVTDINKQPWITWSTTPNCTVSGSDLVKYRVQEGDILVARMADPGKAAYVDSGDPEAVFASYLVRLKALDPSQSLYIYYFLRSATYQAYAEGAMQGSVQMNMNAKVIVGTAIKLPLASTILAFNEKVGPLRQLIQTTLKENFNLAKTRDTLLPQLMSGKLRVRDVEKVAEGTL